MKQRDLALRKANVVRSQRKRLREMLAADEVTLGQVLLDPPECVHSLSVGLLLEFVHFVRTDKSARICQSAGVNWSKPTGDLTLRQRKAVLQAFEDKCPTLAGVRERRAA